MQYALGGSDALQVYAVAGGAYGEIWRPEVGRHVNTIVKRAYKCCRTIGRHGDSRSVKIRNGS